MKKLLKDIRDNNILLEVADGKLKVFTSESQVDPALIAEIRAHREELIQFLLSNDQGDFKQTFTANIPVVAPAECYPLSFAQRRLWVLCQTTDASVAYNMNRVYLFEGALNLTAFQQAFRSLITRHEILRTTFREDEQGEVMQYILSPEESPFRINSQDLRSQLPEAEQLKARVQEELGQPFDLMSDCLLRATLYRVADNKYIFLYAMHHIISDGWSMGVLIQELLQLYSAHATGNNNLPAPLPIQYKDYAVWQLEQLVGKNLELHKAYWLRQFEGSLPILELAADKTRPAIKTYKGSIVTRNINTSLTNRFKTFCQVEGGTLFVGLMAAVNALLYRYTGQEDIILGSPIAGREHVELENQIGFYVNMLALRSRFNGNGSFRDLFAAVKQVTLDAYEHQAYPFDELVEALHLNTDISRHPLFDVVVVLQNTEVAAQNSSNTGDMGIAISGYEDAEQTVSLFDLRLDFRETTDGLKFTIDYNTDIYLESTVIQLSNHLEQLLEVVVAGADVALNKLDYLSAGEKTQLLQVFNDSNVQYPVDSNIVKLFEEQATLTPDNIAVVCGEEMLTYRQLNERANRLAHFLLTETAVKKEEGVGIFLDRRPDCIVAMLGILKAGAMYIPFETETPEERLQFMIGDTNIRTLITETSCLEMVNRLQWSNDNLESYLCIDSANLFEEEEQTENVMMSQELWDRVGQTATDQITGGGWLSSFTGAAISDAEMEEYAMNAFLKLQPSLRKDMRVLEIGCSSGLTLRKIAPEVGLYVGTDLSPVILENTRSMTAALGITNVKFYHLTAHDISLLEENEFDLVIINSVIQHFHGHNYLRKVISDVIALMNDNGRIFIGDVMDMGAKRQMIMDLEEFKAQHKGEGYKTKTDFSADLFVARGFFQDLTIDFKEMEKVTIEEKIFTIENELTKYRYDAIIHIDKKNKQQKEHQRIKHQYSNDILKKQPDSNPGLSLSPDNLAYLIYTSGTTGKPKGVMVQHNNVVRLFKTDKPLFDFGVNDVWTMFHSYCFDFSVWEIYGALLFGGKLVLVPKTTAQDPRAYLELLVKQQVTILNQTPSAFYNLIREELETARPQLQLRYVIFGGEALSPGRLKAWKDRYDNTRLINMYGITETTVHVTYKEITAEEIRTNISNIGRPIPTLSCYVLDALGQLLPIGVPGELYVGGAGVSRGYLHRADLTSQRFIASPFNVKERLYRSGDKVRILNNGEMEYLGRIDDQVKIRGYRIELGEIKNILDQHELVTESVILAKEDVHGDRSLVAYIVSNGVLTIAELRSYLHEKLPEYMVPAYFVELPVLPLTSNGKVDKKALPAPEGLAMATGITYEAARNELEAKLVDIFSNILGIDKVNIGIHDNFFALGGDSIKAMRVVVQIKKQLELGITIGRLYECQTIAELSAWFKEGNAADNVFEQLTAGLEQLENIKNTIISENVTDNKLPEGYEDIYPIVQVEQGMIYSSMLNQDAPVYYDQFSFFLEIADIAHFKRGIQQMVMRHPILRSRYYTSTFSIPVKVVMKEIPLPITFEDLSAMTESEKGEHIQSFLKQDLTVRLGFEGDLLWRLKIFRLDEKQYSVIWSIHHASIDGWSVSIFSREMAELLSPDGGAALSPLKYSYKDYCAILLGKEKKPAVEAYWKKLLNGYTRNKLPFNFKGSRISEETGMKYVSRIVTGDLLSRLQEVASRHQLSFKALCVAAHTYLLHIICSEQDVVTGIVTHDRPPLENSEYIMGCFLNTIPARIDFSQTGNILSFLKTINDYLTAVKSNEIHLSEIAKIIGEKSTSSNPIFDTILNYTDFHLYRDINDSGAVKAYEASSALMEMADASQMTNTLFDVEVGKTMDRFTVSIKYAPAYFNTSDVQYAMDLYVRILDGFTANLYTPLTSLVLLSDQEFKELVKDFNDTDTPYGQHKTMHGLFEEQAAFSPDAIALRQDGIDMTYGVLNEQANQLAAVLLEQGVKPGDNIGLLVSRSFDMIIGMYGILKAGGAYVPIDPEYPADRQTYIAENSGVVKILTDSHYPLADILHDTTFIMIHKEVYAGYNPGNPGLKISSNQLAYTIYTSGSTGRPKGVMIEHHAAVNLIEWVNRTYEVGITDRLLFITSMCFDLSVYDIFGMLAAGGTVVIGRQSEVQHISQLKRLIQEERITFWDSVPTTMNYLVGELEAESDGYIQSTLRLVFLSGDWIPVQLPDRIRQYFPNANVISLGGATEGTVWSNHYPVTVVPASWTSIPYGKPISNNFFYILDDQLRPVPRGVAGELFIGGVGVARGYANDEQKTNFSFRPDPFNTHAGGRMYKTGDLGRLLPDGNMEFLGRKDNQVKIRGFRVELGEIESVLLKYDKIKEAVVDVIKDASNNNQLCGYLVLQEEVDIQEVKAYLKSLLPAYMVPGQYVIMDALPLNSNGKINRKSLPVPAMEDAVLSNEFISPETELEQQIAGIWKRILNIQHIGLNDDIFDIGANSLSVGAFVNRVHKETNLQLTIQEVFSSPTIGGMIKILQNKSVVGFDQIEKVLPRETYPLSSSQRQLWVLNQFEDNNLSYHIPGIYRLEGRLDMAALEHAFKMLVQRHEILRTLFREEEDGTPVQFIMPDATGFDISYVDLRDQPNSEEHMRLLLQQEFMRPFDLAAGPLIRVSLLQPAENKWVLSYTMHHIISDGWSVGILINEWLQLYNAYTSGVSHVLKPLRIQYKDYAVWQQQQLSGTSLHKHRQYWLQQFEGELPVLDLYGDYPRPALKSFKGGTVNKKVDPRLSTAFKSLVQSQGATTFMGLLALVNAILYRYNGQEDIIIGTPVAGRDHADLETQIGFYVNTLALRTKFSGDNSFLELLKTVKDLTLGAYEHQLYPFDELLYELNIQRDVSRGTLFDVMVILQNQGAMNGRQQRAIDNLSVSGYETIENVNSKFDLVFDFVETAETIHVRIEYNSDIFNQRTISRLADHFEQLLGAVLEEPALAVQQLDYLSAEEKQQLLYTFNDTKTTYPDNKTIIDLFEEQARNTPDNTAVLFDEQQLSYRQLNAAANQLGAYLRQHYQLGPQDLAGIKLERSEWMVIALLGVLKTGAGCVPVDPAYPQERIDYIRNDSRWKMLLDENVLQHFMEVSGMFSSENPEPVSIPQHLAYVIYTSGSTGAPKGCMLENAGIINHLYSKINELHLNEHKTICHNSELYFVGGIWQLLAPLVLGGRVVLCNNEELKNIALLLKKTIDYNAEILEIIPSQLNEYLSNENGIQLSHLKTLILTGEKLDPHFVAKCYKGNDHLQIINTYGQTEFSDVTCSYVIPANAGKQRILIGKPIQNTQIHILSSGGLLCPVGVIGEICTSGDGICRGYINKPELTAERFVPNPYRNKRMFKTGDLGRWLPDGTLEIIGRKDDQVKIRGFRIELAEIEQALLQYAPVKEAVVLFHSRIGEERNLVAYVVGDEQLNTTMLTTQLMQRLPLYMLPAYYVQVDKMPLLQNGKINKKELPQLAGINMTSGIEYVAPSNEIESRLAGIWEEILQREHIGVNDNFFLLGGHSLKATTMINKITQVFNVHVSLKEIFQTPDIYNLSEVISRKMWLQRSKQANMETDDSRDVVKL